MSGKWMLGKRIQNSLKRNILQEAREVYKVILTGSMKKNAWGVCDEVKEAVDCQKNKDEINIFYNACIKKVVVKVVRDNTK